MTHYDDKILSMKDDESFICETYLGVDIWKNGYRYSAYLWSDEKQKNLEFTDMIPDNVRYEINEIVAYNYYHALKAISDHFEFIPNFHNPEENLELLRIKISNNINDRLLDL